MNKKILLSLAGLCLILTSCVVVINPTRQVHCCQLYTEQVPTVWPPANHPEWSQLDYNVPHPFVWPLENYKKCPEWKGTPQGRGASCGAGKCG